MKLLDIIKIAWICFILLLLLCAFIYSLFRKHKLGPQGDEYYKKAKWLEEEGKYKEACYVYASAIWNDSKFIPDCEKRLKYLWRTYGPFNYDNFLAEIKNSPETISVNEDDHLDIIDTINEAMQQVTKSEPI